MVKPSLNIQNYLVGIFIACITWLAWSYHFEVAAERKLFNKNQWNENWNIYAHNNDPGCMRGGMAIDLIESKMLNDKSIHEVKSLLGEPSHVHGSSVYYNLGQCSGFGWRDTVLRIDFANNARTTNVGLFRN